MAVGTEVAQPVSILDGVCKSPAGGDPKEDGAAAGDNILTVSEVETTPVEASDPTCLGTLANTSLFCSVPENEGCVQSIPISAVIMDKVEVKTLVVGNEVQNYLPEYRSGGYADQGLRRSMEDAHTCVDNLDDVLGERGAFYGVFDGHDGHSAASYVKMHLLDSILKDASFSTSAEEAVKNAYLKIDDEFAEAWKQDNSFSSGTTVLSALLQGRNLIVANAGDCRAVLCRKGRAVPMSVDHDPTSLLEKKRIESAGGYVSDGYVNGQVTVTRALGDWHMQGLKEVGVAGPLSAEPDIKSLILSEDDEFLIMGCDGLWEVFTNEGAISFARKQLQLHNDPAECSRKLVNEALSRRSQDNITVITICFRADAPPPLVLERRSTVRKSFSLGSMKSLQKDLDFIQAPSCERRCVP